MNWTEDSIRWYKQATEYTRYYRHLFQMIQPYLSKDQSVCDLGCGLGYLSTTLAKHVGHVTAIDVADKPINLLKQYVQANKVTNLEVLHKSWTDIEDKYDTVVSSFFLSEADDILTFLPNAKRQMIIILSNGSEDSFLPDKTTIHYKQRAYRLKEQLDKRNIQYLFIEDKVQFGQPFVEMQDVSHYIQHYAPTCKDHDEQEHIRRYMENISAKSHDFQYFFSNKKDVGIFIINTESAKGEYA